jgi:hypothetical protein
MTCNALHCLCIVRWIHILAYSTLHHRGAFHLCEVGVCAACSQNLSKCDCCTGVSQPKHDAVEATINVALTLFAQADDWRALKTLQNIALTLHKLGHWELSLGYAVAATRLTRFAPKALYWAAMACHKLKHPAAAVWFLLQVWFI